MKQKAFTLIELLVVIVIIGILATISTATFSGYFAKARDTERQTFLENAGSIVFASQIAEDTPDYLFGGADIAAAEPLLVQILADQGLSIPDDKNGISYFYGSRIITPLLGPAYMIFACTEDKLGTLTAGQDVNEVAFINTNINDQIVGDGGPPIGGQTVIDPDICDETPGTSMGATSRVAVPNFPFIENNGWQFVSLND